MQSSRRAQNTMSDYIANLNTSVAAVEPAPEFDDANLFTNTDFFNFDFGDPNSAVEPTSEGEGASKFAWTSPSSSNDVFSNEFQFNPTSNSSGQPSSNGSYPIDVSALQRPHPSSTTNSKRKLLDLGDPGVPLEERTRLAAEEDKRRRNTAASARFRVKKKQREQALEKTAKEMTDKASRLEKRVNELEMENKWLKGLITDKNEGEGDKLSEMFAKLKDELGEKGMEALTDALNADS